MDTLLIQALDYANHVILHVQHAQMQILALPVFLPMIYMKINVLITAQMLSLPSTKNVFHAKLQPYVRNALNKILLFVLTADLISSSKEDALLNAQQDIDYFQTIPVKSVLTIAKHAQTVKLVMFVFPHSSLNQTKLAILNAVMDM